MIRDTQCGFKLFSARAANEIFPLQQVAGWLFDVEILTIARQLGYAIKEVPVDWADAKESKLRAVLVLLGAQCEIYGQLGNGYVQGNTHLNIRGYRLKESL